MWHHPLDQYEYETEYSEINPNEWRYGYTFFVSLLAGVLALAYVVTANNDNLDHGSFKDAVKPRTSNVMTTNATAPTVRAMTPEAAKPLSLQSLKTATQPTTRIKAKPAAKRIEQTPVGTPKQDDPKTQPKRNVTGAF